MSLASPRLGAVAAVVLALASAGCASGVGAGDYSRASVGTINRVEEGVLVSVRPVRIEGSDRPVVGTATGAVLGGIAGSEIGGGEKANTAGAVAGAVIGGIAGGAIERGTQASRGFAYTVRKADGQLITVTQGDDIVMQPGQRVFVEYGARARVVPQ